MTGWSSGRGRSDSAGSRASPRPPARVSRSPRSRGRGSPRSELGIPWRGGRRPRARRLAGSPPRPLVRSQTPSMSIMHTFAAAYCALTDTALPTEHAAPADESALAPLRRPGFRAAWSALAGSQLVIWMNTVGAVTVIAALSDSPTLIALVQTANSLPAVLLALVMGSMADIVDRRRFAVASQSWMLVSVAALAALTLTDAITPELALALTFALGAGMATTFVIYQALTQDFVPRSELMAAVALNGVAINLARAIGPALAGLIIAALSAGALFAVEAGLLVVIVGLVTLRVRPPGPVRASGERFAPAVRAGMRFVRFSPSVRTVLLRGAAFSVSASALWALLPVVAL